MQGVFYKKPSYSRQVLRNFVSFSTSASSMNEPNTNVYKPLIKNEILSKNMIQERTVKYILNCLFTKNNTHFTYSAVTEDLNFLKNNPQLSYNEKFLYYLKLPQKVKFQMSTGNLGFRKAARGEYEASFQSSAKLFQIIHSRKLLDKSIEIIMKDFGKGREAFIAALNGKEGNLIRPHITRISDSTSLKFGGVRAPRPRRL